MKKYGGAIAILLLVGIDPAPARPQETAEDPTVPAAAERTSEELDALAAEIGRGLRCLVCRGQSVQESSAPLAREMQSIIRQKLEEGETPADIEQFFVASYGEFILLKPPAEGLNLVVYVFPVAGFLVAFLTVVIWLRRDRGSPEPVPATPGGAARPDGAGDDGLDASDRAWLDAAVRGDDG